MVVIVKWRNTVMRESRRKVIKCAHLSTSINNSKAIKKGEERRAKSRNGVPMSITHQYAALYLNVDKNYT